MGKHSKPTSKKVSFLASTAAGFAALVVGAGIFIAGQAISGNHPHSMPPEHVTPVPTQTTGTTSAKVITPIKQPVSQQPVAIVPPAPIVPAPVAAVPVAPAPVQKPVAPPVAVVQPPKPPAVVVPPVQPRPPTAKAQATAKVAVPPIVDVEIAVDIPPKAVVPLVEQAARAVPNVSGPLNTVVGIGGNLLDK